MCDIVLKVVKVVMYFEKIIIENLENKNFSGLLNKT